MSARIISLGKIRLWRRLSQNRDINKILIAEGSQRGQMQQLFNWQKKQM